jgi:RNA polymerase sigma-70 factor (ECF subfamily)
MAGLDDTQLMMAVKLGDAAAFKDLVERNRRRAYFAALRLVGNRDDAYDLSQEAFIRVYRARQRYDANSPFHAWFHAIIRNLARNHIRKRSVRRQYAVETRHSYASCTVALDSPEGAMVLGEAKEAIWAAIGRLSADHREIIVLRHFEDKTYEEIAGILGIAVGSVMSRLYYARKRLRDLLGGEHEG